MNVVIALEHRFDRTPEGVVWTQTQFPFSFWKRYLEVFDHVQVVARVRNVLTVPSDFKEANGDRVSFIAIPYYIGPLQYLLRYFKVKRTAQKAVNAEDAVILRVGSTIASCIEPKLRATNHPYGVEVVGDPYDVFAPGSIRHPLRPFFRWLSPQTLRRQCAGAGAAAYVTKHALQARYPCLNYSVGISDVDISDEFLALTPRQFHKVGTLNLLFVGSLAQLYKAPDILINALAICVHKGIDLKLTLVGDGKHRNELEAQVIALGLKKRVCFRGQLTAGKAITTELDQAHLFVLPSYQEGLPRAMVEAMARALPCIGSNVGGIPELLPIEDMVTPGDVDALASKIREVVTDPERMARMSARNLEKAREYRDELLREKRIAFYRYVRQQTESWLLNQKN
jgi:glycosyltransferase involved in cell wall biosynthesis